MTKIKQKSGFGKFALVVLVILLAVSVSGCKGKAKECPVVVSQTDAIKILSFSPGYEDVPVGGSVRLSMDLQNGGNYEATDIKVDLWSHPGFGLYDDQQFKPVPTLYPPDLSICSEGDAYSVQWNMQAGCDPRESIVAASVSYMYKSEGWASILLMSQQEAERLGGQTSGTGENFPSAGPVQIEIESLRNQPLIISKNARSFSIRLKIQNTGDGLAGYKGSGYMNETTLTLSGPCKFVPDSPIFLEREDYDAYTQSGSSKFDPWAESPVDCSDQTQSGFQLQSCVIPQCDCDLGQLYIGPGTDELEDTDCNGYENPTKTVSVGTPPVTQTIAMEIGDRCWDVYQPSMDSTDLNYAVFTTTGDEENNKELTYADAELQLRFGKQDLIKTLSLNYNGNMNFVKDFCTISVVSNYGYRVTEQLKGKFGIYGSSDEITNCRAPLTN